MDGRSFMLQEHYRVISYNIKNVSSDYLRRRVLPVLPLLFAPASRQKPHQVQQALYPSAITGGPVAALPLRFGAPLWSHVPSASSRLLSASCRLYRAAFKSPLCKASPDVLSPSLHSLFQYPAAATSDRSFIRLQ